MEEEQEDFAHDLANLQSDVGKLKELVKLSGAVKNENNKINTINLVSPVLL